MTTSSLNSPDNNAPEKLASANKSRLTRKMMIWLGGICLVLVACAGYWYFFMQTNPAGDGTQASGKPGGGRNAGGRSTPVMVGTAKKGDIGVYIVGLGTVTPMATVTVKSRVDGQLMQVLFREGQMVREGEPLAELDPRPYQVMLDQATGQMLKDQALLDNARIDLERYRMLFEQDSIAKQQLDTQASLVRQYEGAVKIDQSAIDNAKLQLSYCRITAPVNGRVGLRQVDHGNVVHASDTTGLVIITQLQPITVVFAIPEDNLPAVMQKLQSGKKLLADAYDRADANKIASGMVLTMDNQIDPATGTVKLKAQFANDDNKLFPNQFANIHMLLDFKRDAILIPTAAIQHGTPGTFVYLVNADNTVTVRVVKPGTTQGGSVAIEDGLLAGDQVVIDGLDKLREGAKVEPVSKDASSVQRKKGAGDSQGLTNEEKQKRWEQTNARIDRGEFGEEIKKLSEEERKQRMRDLGTQREAGQSGSEKKQ